jgi:hypothetical protein
MICTDLVNKLYSNEMPELALHRYPTLIEENGGVDQVVRDVLSHVTLNLFQLEGQALSPAQLVQTS